MQPLFDKVAKRLPPWKERLLNRCGRLFLVQSTLGAIPVHIYMALKIAPCAVKAIETLMTGEVVSRGKVIAWVNTYVPKDLGGLGTPNLSLMGCR